MTKTLDRQIYATKIQTPPATTQRAADADDAMLGSDTAAAARGGVDANDAAAASLGDTAADADDAVDALLGLPLLP